MKYVRKNVVKTFLQDIMYGESVKRPTITIGKIVGEKMKYLHRGPTQATANYMTKSLSGTNCTCV